MIIQKYKNKNYTTILDKASTKNDKHNNNNHITTTKTALNKTSKIPFQARKPQRQGSFFPGTSETLSFISIAIGRMPIYHTWRGSLAAPSFERPEGQDAKTMPYMKPMPSQICQLKSTNRLERQCINTMNRSQVCTPLEKLRDQKLLGCVSNMVGLEILL